MWFWCIIGNYEHDVLRIKFPHEVEMSEEAIDLIGAGSGSKVHRERFD